jgi:hypothetical protein
VNQADAPANQCPRCGGAFACGAGQPGPCVCATITLSPALQDQLRQAYSGCLCLACLRQLAAAEAASGAGA